MKKVIITSLMTAALVLALVPIALAAEGDEANPELVGMGLALAAGFCVSFAAAGGTIGQGLAIKGAMDGIARNPNASGKIQTSMIIGLALIESLVIYSLVISFFLIGKI